MTQPTDFATGLGIEFVEVTPDRVICTCKVTPEMHQPFGIVHGGVYCSIVETAASVAGAAWFSTRNDGEGSVAGVVNTTNFIRATREGLLTATATPLQRGRTQQLWQVEIVDEQQRLVAHGQVRLANLANTEHLGR
jgi:uncharacterized protein (TIGR00369 family)